MREQREGPWADSRYGGPWTRHGHPIRGKTVLGELRPPNVARCGGVHMCRICQADAEAAVTPEAAPVAAQPTERDRARAAENDETTALDVVYAWLGGDRAARTLLLAPEYVSLRANIAQALADARADEREAALRGVRELAAEMSRYRYGVHFAHRLRALCGQGDGAAEGAEKPSQRSQDRSEGSNTCTEVPQGSHEAQRGAER